MLSMDSFDGFKNWAYTLLLDPQVIYARVPTDLVRGVSGQLAGELKRMYHNGTVQLRKQVKNAFLFTLSTAPGIVLDVIGN